MLECVNTSLSSPIDDHLSSDMNISNTYPSEPLGRRLFRPIHPRVQVLKMRFEGSSRLNEKSG